MMLLILCFDRQLNKYTRLQQNSNNELQLHNLANTTNTINQNYKFVISILSAVASTLAVAEVVVA